MTYLIGLTGGIGSGKTTVAHLFAQHNIVIVDADQISRIVVEPGQPALTKIHDHFGSQVIDSNGQLNRTWLRKKVFDSPQERKWLEALLHPLIAQEILSEIQASTSPYTILTSPLLIEAQQYKWVQRILVVDTPEELQIARTMHRDHTNVEDIKKIIDVQLTRQERLKWAEDVIINDQDLDHLTQEVEKLHHHYLTIAAQHHD